MMNLDTLRRGPRVRCARAISARWSFALTFVVCAACGDLVDRSDGRRSLATDSLTRFDVAVAGDGRIAYSKPVNGASAIFVADSRGGSHRKLTDGVWDFGPRWSPDGRFIAFERETNALDVMLLSVEDGRVRGVATTPATERVIGWTADGTGVVFGRMTGERYETWVFSIADSTSRLLVDTTGAIFAVPSPDGRWIGYEHLVQGRRTIWLQDVATGARRQLTTEGFESIPNTGAVWSADGRRLAYLSTRSGTSDIWVVDVESGVRTQVTRDVREDFQPRYAPSGNRIAFISSRGGQTDVWVASDSGGDERRVTDDVAIETAFAWSHDGEELFVIASDARSQLYTLPIDGGAARPLTDGDAPALWFAIAPDASRIVYERGLAGAVDLMSIPMAGGAPTVVVASPADEYGPSVSPDSKRVVFASMRSGAADIFVAPIEGGDAIQLTDWPSREDVPVWSPDGRHIAFRSNRDALSDLWIMNADGSAPRKLTTSIVVNETFEFSHDGRRIAVTSARDNGAIAVELVDVDGSRRVTLPHKELMDPTWSPNDSLLAVANAANGFAHIDLWTASGTFLRRLTPRAKTYARSPRFSPDGRSIMYVDYEYANDYYEISIVPVDSGPPRRLSTIRGAARQARWAPDGRSIIYSGAPTQALFYSVRVPR